MKDGSRFTIVALAASLVAGLAIGCTAGRAPAAKAAAYPAEGQVLAALDIDEDSFGNAKFALARIVTPVGEATKGKAEVQFLASPGGPAKDGKKWTSNLILKTHPAAKDELVTGAVALVPVGGDAWSRAVVAGGANVLKGQVRLAFYRGPKPDPADRTSIAAIGTLRISDDPVFKNPRQ